MKLNLLTVCSFAVLAAFAQAYRYGHSHAVKSVDPSDYDESLDDDVNPRFLGLGHLERAWQGTKKWVHNWTADSDSAKAQSAPAEETKPKDSEDSVWLSNLSKQLDIDATQSRHARQIIKTVADLLETANKSPSTEDNIYAMRRLAEMAKSINEVDALKNTISHSQPQTWPSSYPMQTNNGFNQGVPTGPYNLHAQPPTYNAVPSANQYNTYAPSYRGYTPVSPVDNYSNQNSMHYTGNDQAAHNGNPHFIQHHQAAHAYPHQQHRYNHQFQ